MRMRANGAARDAIVCFQVKSALNKEAARFFSRTIGGLVNYFRPKGIVTSHDFLFLRGILLRMGLGLV